MAEASEASRNVHVLTSGAWMWIDELSANGHDGQVKGVTGIGRFLKRLFSAGR